MATAPVTLDQTPQPPADVRQQMGATGQDAAKAALMQRIAQAIQQKQAQQGGQAPAGPAQNMAGAAPNPQGALLAKGQQIEQLITQMGTMNPNMGPWSSRLISLLRAAVGDVVGSTATPGSPQSPGSTDADGGSSSATGTATPPQGPLNNGFAG